MHSCLITYRPFHRWLYKIQANFDLAIECSHRPGRIKPNDINVAVDGTCGPSVQTVPDKGTHKAGANPAVRKRNGTDYPQQMHPLRMVQQELRKALCGVGHAVMVFKLKKRVKSSNGAYGAQVTSLVLPSAAY